jgi:deoxyribonuclease-4
VRRGVHLALGAGYEGALEHARWLGCTTVQVFTHSPRTFAFKPLEPKRQQVLLDGWKRLGISPVVSHASYLINIGAANNKKFYGALSILKNEIVYAKAFGCAYLVLHVGKHTGSGKEQSVQQVAKGIEKLADTLRESEVMLLLEIAAGQGTEIGRTFEELQEVLEKLDAPTSALAGVCLDTCHLFAAGYDITTKEGAESVVRNIERTFGMQRVRIVHVNDSKFGLGERKDRHENVGKGKIGADGLRAFLTHPKIKGLPMILETPFDDQKEQKADLDALNALLR